MCNHATRVCIGLRIIYECSGRIASWKRRSASAATTKKKDDVPPGEMSYTASCRSFPFMLRRGAAELQCRYLLCAALIATAERVYVLYVLCAREKHRARSAA